MLFLKKKVYSDVTPLRLLIVFLAAEEEWKVKRQLLAQKRVIGTLFHAFSL
jgi:hypothetical protein